MTKSKTVWKLNGVFAKQIGFPIQTIVLSTQAVGFMAVVKSPQAQDGGDHNRRAEQDCGVIPRMNPEPQPCGVPKMDHS